MLPGECSKKLFLGLVVVSVIICSIYYNNYTYSIVHYHISSVSQSINMPSIMKRIAEYPFFSSEGDETNQPSETTNETTKNLSVSLNIGTTKTKGAAPKQPGPSVKTKSQGKSGAAGKTTTETKTKNGIKSATSSKPQNKNVPLTKTPPPKPKNQNPAAPKTATNPQNKNTTPPPKPPNKNATPPKPQNKNVSASETSTSKQSSNSPGPTASPAPQGKKYLIYLCDSSRWCGGWGDRQRGIFTVFLASFAYNRTFGIEMTSPCPLQKFFEPNEVNWLIDRKELVNKTVRVIDAMGRGPPFLGNFTEDVIKIKINSDASYSLRHHFNKLMPKYTQKVSRAVMFRRVWNKLMKPTKHLEEHIQQIANFTDRTKNNTEKLVCAHVRIGKSVDLPNDPPRVDPKTVDKLWTFLQRYDNKSKIFIATDNSKVRASARAAFGDRYFDTGGKILHIDRQRYNKEACLGFETSLVDQSLLSRCDVLVVSPSNFSVRAAMLKKVLNEMYAFGGGAVSAYKPNRKRRSVSNVETYFVNLGDKILTVYML